MTSVTVEKAQADLPNLIKRAVAGEEIVIEATSLGSRIKLEIMAADTFNPVIAKQRGYGTLRGRLAIDKDFFDPLPDCETGTDR
jgi:hypothetical protein